MPINWDSRKSFDTFEEAIRHHGLSPEPKPIERNASVTVMVSDGHNEDLAFDVYISPGLAPVGLISDLFVAMSGLHRAFGGEGLTFKVVGADVPPECSEAGTAR